MYRLGECSLVYVHQSKDEDYNPIIETYTKIVKCQLMDAFSVNYYQSQTRDMQRSKNIIVSKHYSFNTLVDGKTYQLEYVDFGIVRYKVKNVLKDKNSSLNVVLDCEEVMNE